MLVVVLVKRALFVGALMALVWRPPGLVAAQLTDTGLVVIDGAKTPEQIPDQVAIQHFLVSLIPQLAEMPQHSHRREMHLARLGLSETDIRTFRTHLSKLGPPLLEIDDQLRSASEAAAHDGARSDALRARRRTLLETEAASLFADLSASGGHAVLDYVRQYVKPRVMVFSTP